jgi:hypothetical protein
LSVVASPALYVFMSKKEEAYVQDQFLNMQTISARRYLKEAISCRVARFFLVLHTKTGKIYTKIPYTIPNGYKIYQMASK